MTERQISLDELRRLLAGQGLLRAVIVNGRALRGTETPPDMSFTKLSYDSRNVDNGAFFFVKGGGFKEEYLKRAFEAGAAAYAAERSFENENETARSTRPRTALIVHDIKKTMAVCAAEFYGNPHRKLRIIAFTGTKGKTTAAYYAKNILDRAGYKTALFSTITTTLDGTRRFRSELTTPESLDLFRMMAQAVENGATRLVMEVSSQAYKTNRVYGIVFDIGVFLNISPDHIGPVEHPGFDDYFACKRQLLHNSRIAILNRNSAHFDILLAEAQAKKNFADRVDSGESIPAKSVYVVGTEYEGTDAYIEPGAPDEPDIFPFTIKTGSLAGLPGLTASCTTHLAGNFNAENALAAAAAARLAGAKSADIIRGIAETQVPGRMERLTAANGAAVYIDYAHNGASLAALLGVVKSNHTGAVIVVMGATGNKGQSRRKDLGEVLGRMASAAVLTADDPAFEDPHAIAEEIRAAIGANETTETHIIIDRAQAIRFALTLVHGKEDALVIAGKGADCFQIVNGKKTPYDGDYTIAQTIIAEERRTSLSSGTSLS